MDTCIWSNPFVRSYPEKEALSKEKAKSARWRQWPSASEGRGARLSSMVNKSEPLINVVKLERAKDADRLEPKGKQPVDHFLG